MKSNEVNNLIDFFTLKNMIDYESKSDLLVISYSLFSVKIKLNQFVSGYYVRVYEDLEVNNLIKDYNTFIRKAKINKLLNDE